MPLQTFAALFTALRRRIGLTTRILLVAGIAGGVGTAGCLYAVLRKVEGEAEATAQRSLEANLTLLRALGNAEGREFRMDGERFLAVRRDAAGAVVTETPLNGRLDIVDEVKRSLGGVATIFAGDTRVATNVTRPDGSRGVGTKLAAGAAHDAVFRRGETFRGVADILGRSHITIYEPIRDRAGRTVGIWFVGLPQDEFQTGIADLKLQLGLFSLVALLVAGVSMVLMLRWQLAPLHRLRQRVEAVAAGELAHDDRYQDRGDEIGAMARAVGIFRDNAEKLAAAEGERAALERRASASRAEVEERLIAAVGTVVDAARMGDFTQRAEASAELGRMSALVHGLNAVTSACDAFLDEADRALAGLAGGDLTVRMANAFEGRLQAVAGNFNRATTALAATFGEVADGVAATRHAAGEIRGATSDLSGRTESQAASLEETAAAVEEIAKTVSQTAETVDGAARNAEENAARAKSGAEVAQRAVEAIDRVEAQARKIVEIVGVMDGIAFQTNLLALNASVEAARAGDSGRGFAVVANEVRRLAQQSADAARDVRGLITETNAHVEQGVQLVKTAGDQLGLISQAADQVAITFGAIRQSTREQSAGVGDIARSLQTMDEMTQANAAAAEETAAGANSLMQTAEKLAELTARFQTRAAPPTKRRAA